ncbi:MAG: TRAP transporter TatT component family protein [Myxococcales bacterium]|nr:TRAP transporter TatT component family protein [Polyangiaceae bacterium]MDW8251129.1 TRAP transporter TatT component family protein [Myxococcales bacterium]
MAARRDDPSAVLWLGIAWMGRLRVATENHRQLATQSRVGEQLLEHALARDPTRAGLWGHLFLGLWRRRIGGDPVQVRIHFEQAAQLAQEKHLFNPALPGAFHSLPASGQRALGGPSERAPRCSCPAPEQRIDNAIAKRRAARDLLVPHRAQCMP